CQMIGANASATARSHQIMKIAIAVAGLLLSAQFALAQVDNTIEIVHVRGPVYLIAGGGCNITISVGPDGSLLVDTGAAQMSDKVVAAIRQLQRQLTTADAPLKYGSENRSELQALRATPPPPKPIRYILNTQLDSDHTGGNEKIAKAGKTIAGGN